MGSTTNLDVESRIRGFAWNGEGAVHGQLLDRRPLTLVKVLSEACRHTELVWYLSTGIEGGPTIVTGALLVPRDDPPPGGWPIVAWGAGGAGLSFTSANSRFPSLNFTGEHYANFLAVLLRAGFAIAATDYEGRAGPGSLRPFQAPYSEGRSMIDFVLAARQAHRRLASAWFAVGHSGGGHAVLEAAEAAELGYDEDLELHGVVSIESAGDFSWVPDHLDRLLDWVPDNRPAIGRAIYLGLVAGLKVQFAELSLSDYLGAGAMQRLEIVYQSPDFDEVWKAFADLPASEFGPRSEEAARRLRTMLAAHTVPRRRVGAPVFFPAGESQAAAPMHGPTEDAARRLGDSVVTIRYPGVDHREVLGACAEDVVQWLRERLAPAI